MKAKGTLHCKTVLLEQKITSYSQVAFCRLHPRFHSWFPGVLESWLYPRESRTYNIRKQSDRQTNTHSLTYSLSLTHTPLHFHTHSHTQTHFQTEESFMGRFHTDRWIVCPMVSNKVLTHTCGPSLIFKSFSYYPNRRMWKEKG